MRAAYVAAVLLVLSPSVAIALFTLIVLTREPTFVRERSSREALHHYSIRLAGVEIRFYPRVWPSVVLLAGAVLWIIGLTVLFFIRR